MATYAYPKNLDKNIKYIVLGIIILILIVAIVNIFSFFTVIKPGDRGLLLKFGEIEKIYEPGLHFQIPLVNQIITMDVRTQKDEVAVGASSKDLQEIIAKVALNYHLAPLKIDEVYKQIGFQYVSRIISPAIQESVKASTAQFTAEELITKRAEVKKEIKENLIKRLTPYNIIIDDFSIVDFSFSPEFNQAIELKQTAEQRALKAENDLKRIEIEAKQKIETAKADAESIRIQAAALKENTNLIQLKFVEKWDGKLPVYMLGNSAIPFLNIK